MTLNASPCLRTPASGEAAHRYWASKAPHYPQPGNALATGRAARLRMEAENLGVRFDVPAIIDIGAGTGLHASALAERAQRVVAVDLSAEMLAPLARQALPNVEVHALDWAQADIDALRWRKAFDLAWAVMTPAVGEPELLAKMEATSRHQCCAMVWGAWRDDPLLTEAFGLHGVRFEAPGWTRVIAEYLKTRHRPHTLTTIPDGLSQEVSPEGLCEDLAAHLEWLGIPPNRPALRTWAATIARGGKIRREVSFELDIWVWQV